MKNNFLPLFIFMGLCSFTACKGQRSFGEDHLSIEKTIQLTGVKGRIDHLDVNLKDQIIYIAALGNNSLEVVSLANGRVLHHISGLDEPQGVCYIPQTKEIFVANGGNGDGYFFNADSYMRIATVHLSSDADDVRYDSTGQKIYVAYGSGGIAIIDAKDHHEVADIKLPSHPEGFQIDKHNNLLYVNLPKTGAIGVVDISKLKLINEWKYNHGPNFPMALDREGNKLFIGFRNPGKLAIIDTKTGKQLAAVDLTNDSDDLFYDARDHKVYASCGGGAVNIFQIEVDGSSIQIAALATRKGARTSLLIPERNLFVVCEPAALRHEADMVVYKYPGQTEGKYRPSR
jgi:DNA-binding beta-propeller fold protein YncE